MQAKTITLKNDKLEVTIINYGARVTGLITADKTGRRVNVVTGFKTVDEYLTATSPYYGAIIGRYANRIAGGQFSLNGNTYNLTVNNGPNTLHGGHGFHDKLWTIAEAADDKLVLKYFSPDGEDGFPGDMNVQVTYQLKDNALAVSYEATTSKDTVVNLTNHCFYNLNGEGSGSVLNHKIQILANAYTRINTDMIPTGAVASVAGTPFDFREAGTIGNRIADDHPQLNYAGGYDHNYILIKGEGNGLTPAAKATGDITGIDLEVYTTEPGVHFYSGNFMDGTNTFKGGAKDDFRTAFALETQHFPDSPNQPLFPSTVLSPGEVFRSASLYRFSVSK